jgi:hypothetical protein
MFESDEEIPSRDLPDKFANFFDSKVENVALETIIDADMYNGTKKVDADNHFFIDQNYIKECIMSLTIKNLEGFDQIPQRIIVDGCSTKKGWSHINGWSPKPSQYLKIRVIRKT